MYVDVLESEEVAVEEQTTLEKRRFLDLFHFTHPLHLSGSTLFQHHSKRHFLTRQNSMKVVVTGASGQFTQLESSYSWLLD